MNIPDIHSVHESQELFRIVGAELRVEGAATKMPPRRAWKARHSAWRGGWEGSQGRVEMFHG